MMALLQAVDCIRLYVPDLEAGLAFYRDTLGHRLVWRSEDAVGLAMPGSATELVLHTDPIPPEIDFKVASADDAAQQIEAAGGKVIVPPFDIQIGRCAVVEDPWGNAFVVLDASKGLLITDDEGHILGNADPD
jgi:predicted enzyme related to lactoylglutathione lyase